MSESLDPMAIDEALHIAHQPIGQAPEAASKDGIDFHGGLIAAPVHGRTDKIPLNIPSGSYVLPADIVSAIGQGNTIAGAKTIQEVMKSAPYDAGSGPYGSDAGTMARGSGRGIPEPPEGSPSMAAAVPTPHMARGGNAPLVPIIAAGGEYVLLPHECAYLGEGDTKKGHRALDQFVVDTREHLRKTLAKLKPPKKN